MVKRKTVNVAALWAAKIPFAEYNYYSMFIRNYPHLVSGECLASAVVTAYWTLFLWKMRMFAS